MTPITIEGKEFAIITMAEYDQFVEDTNNLMCLEAAGVDNWEGYEVAVRMRDGESQEGDF